MPPRGRLSMIPWGRRMDRSRSWLNGWRRWRAERGLARALRRALADGVGLYRAAWDLDPAREASADLFAWLEGAISQTRRPYGMDQVALSLACSPRAGAPLASASFGAFRPQDLYLPASPLRREIGVFIDTLPVAPIVAGTAPLRLGAVLLSWGDLARATIYADAPARSVASSSQRPVG